MTAPAALSPTTSFQDLILTLQNYLGGAGLRDPAAL